MLRSCETLASQFVRKDEESSFHHYRLSVKLVHATLRVRKGIEKKFLNYGGPAKLMHDCVTEGTLKAVFTTLEVLSNFGGQFMCQENVESISSYCGSPARFVQASLCVRNDVE